MSHFEIGVSVILGLFVLSGLLLVAFVAGVLARWAYERFFTFPAPRPQYQPFVRSEEMEAHLERLLTNAGDEMQSIAGGRGRFPPVPPPNYPGTSPVGK